MSLIWQGIQVVKKAVCKTVIVSSNLTLASKGDCMEEVCSFIINNRVYTIYDVDRIEGKKSYVGRSDYIDTDIYIERGTFEQMMLTLKHELMHVWLYENGHTNQDGQEIFDYEDVCELVALSNNSINRIVNLYCYKKRLSIHRGK